MCRPYLVGIGLTVSDGPADGETDVQYGDVEGAACWERRRLARCGL